jgi:hypothetical protein
MKKEELVKLGVAEEVADQIIILHGKDIEKFKVSVEASQGSVTTIQKQLDEANATIESFKKMDIEGVKKTAEDWKQKAEQIEKDSKAQLALLKFDTALDSALGTAKAKNIKAVKALLKAEDLKLSEKDGSIIGLKEQLEQVKTDNEYLFDSDVPETPTPKIVLGANGKKIVSDPTVMAARVAAGLPNS